MKNSFFKNKSFKSFLDFFSRLSISAIFISAIPGKINDFERTVEYISSKGIPEPISSILSWEQLYVLSWVLDFLYLEKIKKLVQPFYYYLLSQQQLFFMFSLFIKEQYLSISH